VDRRAKAFLSGRADRFTSGSIQWPIDNSFGRSITVSIVSRTECPASVAVVRQYGRRTIFGVTAGLKADVRIQGPEDWNGPCDQILVPDPFVKAMNADSRFVSSSRNSVSCKPAVTRALAKGLKSFSFSFSVTTKRPSPTTVDSTNAA
jgi:hypothetical protein